jgi:hypothetical protein
MAGGEYFLKQRFRQRPVEIDFAIMFSGGDLERARTGAQFHNKESGYGTNV